MPKRIDRAEFLKTLQSFSMTEPSFPVWTLTFGGHKSRRAGEGMEFKEFRQYELGEDIANLDVEATLRTGERLVRDNLTEEKLRHVIVLDDSPSLRFYGMRETALVAAGCYLISAVKTRDPARIISVGRSDSPSASPGVFSTEEAVAALLDLWDTSASMGNGYSEFARFASDVLRITNLSSSFAVFISDFAFSDVTVRYDNSARKMVFCGRDRLKYGLDALVLARESRDLAFLGVAPDWREFSQCSGFIPSLDAEDGTKTLIRFTETSARIFVERQLEREKMWQATALSMGVPMAWIHSGDNIILEIEKAFCVK